MRLGYHRLLRFLTRATFEIPAEPGTLQILIVSERTFPSVGGVQTVTQLLGVALIASGHKVTVATCEPGNDENVQGILVLRRPGALRLFSEYRRADAIVLQGLPIRLGWPLLLLRRVALAVHHLQPLECEAGLSKCLRGKLATRVRHAAVSRALAKELPWRTEMILPNPYDDAVFRDERTLQPSRDVIFVGRLIPEKGVPVLIEALAILRQRGQPVTATIVGDGPEKGLLEEMTWARKLQQWISFTGVVTGRALARLLIQHQLMVVPSIYQEPFGVVALEGIACGCAVIASDAGGLPEALGSCGTTFPMGDAASLAATIQYALASPAEMEQFRAGAESHLTAHRPSVVVRNYLELLCPPESAGISPGRSTMSAALRRRRNKVTSN